MPQDSLTPRRNSVLIIGGGVAGIAAGVALAGSGFEIEIIEKRPMLGGRASSYTDPKTGELLDECQHGTMRCCTNLTDLFNRLGVNHLIEYQDSISFLDGEGKRSSIAGCGLPAPAHTSYSFLTFKSLGLRDKIGIARAMFAMLRSPFKPEYETTTIADWFRSFGQTERAIKRFWTPILVSACNETIDRISCEYAFKLFRDGFLLNASGFHFGIPGVPLGELYTEPAINLLAKSGGRVRLRTIVERVEFEGTAESRRVTGITLQNGEQIQADYYITALQCDLLAKLLPCDIVDSSRYWKALSGIELSPIIGVHLWFDRPIDCPQALALLDRETEWIFHKTGMFDKSNGSGSYLSAVISASRRYLKTSKGEILEIVLKDVRECLPDAATAELVRSRVVHWPKATISPIPGVDECRVIQTSPISNLFVAGEWTKTGWPSTMEGAARSGYLAAEAILKQDGLTQTVVAPDLRPGRLARALDGRRRG